MKIKHETASAVILTHKDKNGDVIEFHVPKAPTPFYLLPDGSQKLVEYSSPYGKLIRRELSK
jgi:hypothetical protein